MNVCAVGNGVQFLTRSKLLGMTGLVVTPTFILPLREGGGDLIDEKSSGTLPL
jgi:hypothetical protein